MCNLRYYIQSLKCILTCVALHVISTTKMAIDIWHQIYNILSKNCLLTFDTKHLIYTANMCVLKLIPNMNIHSEHRQQICDIHCENRVHCIYI